MTQTPLIELLERIPQDARLIVEHDQFSSSSHPVGRMCHEAAAALRAALAKPEQEPVAWIHGDEFGDACHWVGGSMPPAGTKLYTAPPQRKPLTPSSPCEMTPAERKMFKLGWLECEAAHGIKENT